MIDFKKISILALLASAMGTGQIFAARVDSELKEEDNTTNSPPLQQTIPVREGDTEDKSNNNIPSITPQPAIGNEGKEPLENQQLIDAINLLSQFKLIQEESEQVEALRRANILTEAQKQLDEKQKELLEAQQLLEEE